MPNRHIMLNNGVTIPLIGHGSWQSLYPTTEEQAQVKVWIASALKAGYRHIDTALMYGTEKPVGEAIRESGIAREEIFITTKFPLRTLDVDYVDLYLIHWPQACPEEKGAGLFPKNADGSIKNIESVTFIDSWKEMEKLLSTGKVKSIGVSNFSTKTLHPYLVQDDLNEYCKKKGIRIISYTPGGGEPVRSDPLINELATKYKVTPNQVILAWHIARDIIILPKSSNAQRQIENITLPTLDPEDVTEITKLDRNQRISNKADAYGQVLGWTYERLGWSL
ncbi:reductase AKOR2 [Macrolepiota fuliginosa MF-IS2]|uniref:Reductase AKOR2 n=1 Tax=Macrolepiota fuliginosa MF-IS2 TaxID=1400762 RepID=A0A9P6C4U9_9AGAR|nr:reductase AKOR2 [Macrolepiota fuliginosa MF-IS2]